MNSIINVHIYHLLLFPIGKFTPFFPSVPLTCLNAAYCKAFPPVVVFLLLLLSYYFYDYHLNDSKRET